MSVTDVYDIREIIQVLQEHGINDEETLARTLNNETPSTASSGAASILSSAETAQTTNHSADVANSGPSSSLSINPSMIDSSLTSFLSSLSKSNPSHDSISSVSSQSTPCHSPDSFASIGRFLSADNECDGISVLSLMTSAEEIGEAAVGGGKWWEQIKDWDSFTADANNYLKLLILEEMKESDGVEKYPLKSSGMQSHPGAFVGVWQWFQGLYETITRAGSNQEKVASERAKYMSSLIKQVVVINQELDEMAPEPPSLPEDLTLDDVPDHIRQKLLEHHARVNEWRKESMKRREKLESTYATCQEKLLACIIDMEEEVFWKKGTEHRDNKWNSLNDDGYVEVVSKNIPENVNVCQSKSTLSQYAMILAGVIGAGIAVVVSTVFSKRRGC